MKSPSSSFFLHSDAFRSCALKNILKSETFKFFCKFSFALSENKNLGRDVFHEQVYQFKTGTC